VFKILSYVIIKGIKKLRQNITTNTANFCENGKNHGKITASNYGPKNHYKLYKTQQTTIITWRAKFSFVKFCRCGALKYKFPRDVTVTYWANK